MDDFVDVSGALLSIGDKVATQYEQLFRIGIIQGFTKQKVIVGFDYSETGQTPLQLAKLNPWKLAKVVNQQCGLRDYFNYIKI